ncbi:type 11 methyltransferase [Actinoplanes sp. SE50]|uniref:class I SAM-dependent methyltransferase n=1 Tax=unclassified Actinoplanes TaxID=2626549 RepID=UPI00023ECCC3|nr:MULTISPECIES: class I SAM-dependent methyltransferase [unclassified Actinoplanes]AEV84827.1 Ubiquinone/menaquinone biosynthesis methyltransferase ubiE [Actinoplanes sp. SE50/110]ATO83219.1 type 11 methyltransferase [Actinoplanes sp. SE50]SLM00626.1 type 11 methyltransferase [Actinoplanes sp. SE50/110]
MALIAYDNEQAAAFEETRHLQDDDLATWRAAIGRHFEPRSGARLLDLGCGTGSWARAFRTWWPGVEVLAVEPSAAMRERAMFQPVAAGAADDIPLPDASLDGVWLSTVIHHVPDLEAAAREIRRVLKPGAPVLIRSAFAGRHEAINLFRWFPEAVAVLDRYPSIPGVEAAFATAGFATTGCEPVPQVTAPSVADAAAALRREAHTPLQLISDEAYAAGVARLREAARTESGPVVDALDLLVLR